MTFLILGLFLGTLVAFFTAILLVCAAHSEREDAIARAASGGAFVASDPGECRRVAAAVRD